MTPDHTKTLTNRDVLEAVEAITALSDQGWEDAVIALRLGRTFRSLSLATDEINETRKTMLKAHAERTGEGAAAKIVQEGGTVQVKDGMAFQDEWRTLLKQPAEVKIYPVALERLVQLRTGSAGNGRKGPCKECKRDFGLDIKARYLEVLVRVGAVEVKDAEEE